MGKLIDRLERMQKSGSARIGFAQVTAAKQASLLLMGALPSANRNLATAAVNGGADCLLIQSEAAAEVSLREKLGVAEGIPCGGAASGDEAGHKGWDFVVVDTDAHMGPWLNADGADPVLKLGADTPDSILRTLESLPFEAFIVPEPPDALTVQGLIGYYRVTKATSKPVLGLVSAKADPGMLRALRDAGLAGILVEIKNTAEARALAELKKAIEALPPKKNKASRNRAAVALGLPLSPGPSSAPAPAAPDEDDED